MQLMKPRLHTIKNTWTNNVTASQMRRTAAVAETPSHRLGKKFLLVDRKDPAYKEFRPAANDIYNANRQPAAIIR